MHQRGRSGRKQPPQQREPQKQRKSLEDACKDIKKNLATEYQVKVSAEKRKRDQELEDEQMRMIYGPNWRDGLPSWADEADRVRESEPPEAVGDDPDDYDDDDDDGERVIPFPRREKKRKAS